MPPTPKHTAQGDAGKCVCTSTPRGHGPGRPSPPALWDLLCSLLGALPVSWKGGHLRVRGLPVTKLPRVCCNTTAKGGGHTVLEDHENQAQSIATASWGSVSKILPRQCVSSVSHHEWEQNRGVLKQVRPKLAAPHAEPGPGLATDVPTPVSRPHGQGRLAPASCTGLLPGAGGPQCSCASLPPAKPGARAAKLLV